MENTRNLESYATRNAELVLEGRRNGIVTRETAENFLENVGEAAIQKYGGEEYGLSYGDFTVGLDPDIVADEDLEELKYFDSREEGIRELADLLEEGEIDNVDADRVVATRPSGIGPAALIADHLDIDYSVPVFYEEEPGIEGPFDLLWEKIFEDGNQTTEDRLPGDAENVVEFNRRFSSDTYLEFFGDQPRGGESVILAGDSLGHPEESDTLLNYLKDMNVERMIMAENWN